MGSTKTVAPTSPTNTESAGMPFVCSRGQHPQCLFPEGARKGSVLCVYCRLHEMGKRKAKLLQPKKTKLPKLDKEFECPFCSHLRSVLVKMDRGRGVASLSCRICGASFDKRINRLDEAVDVYGAWIDACVAANTHAAEQAKKRMASLIGGGGVAPLGTAGERNNSSIGGAGGVGPDPAAGAIRTGRAGEKRAAAAATAINEGTSVGGTSPRNGVRSATDGVSGQTPPRSGAGASAWNVRDREAAAAGGSLREGEFESGADSNSGRGASSTTSSRRLIGAGGSGSSATTAVAPAAGGGSRLRRLRLERRQEDYSTSEEEDEVDEGFEFSAVASDDEQQRGSGKSARRDETGDSGALDVLTRLREQQREEEENDADAGAGDLFGDDE